MSKTLLILQGCPLSGKSTWAKSFIQGKTDSWKIVNRDTIRYRLGDGKYSMEYEQEVTKIEYQEMDQYAEEGYNIIQDSTNLKPNKIKRLQEWANSHNYEIEYKLFYVSYKEALERNKKRTSEGGLHIPTNVLTDFYKRYFPERLEEEVRDKRIEDSSAYKNTFMAQCIICDLDGTLAMHNGRTPFEFDRINEDLIDTRLKEILQSLKLYSKIIFITGRHRGKNDEIYEATQKWLLHNFDNEGNYILYMRENDDYGHGEDVKKKIYEDNVKGKYKVLCVFEDSNKCVDMWRKEGLLTLQVQNNDY